MRHPYADRRPVYMNICCMGAPVCNMGFANRHVQCSGTCLRVEHLPEARRAHDSGSCCWREGHRAALVSGHGSCLHCILLQALQDPPLPPAPLGCLHMAL